jgi:ribosomal protein S21
MLTAESTSAPDEEIRPGVSRTRRPEVTVRVVIGDGEGLSQALQRLARLVQKVYGRPWTKRRFGYFEKPSVLRRKRERMSWRQRQVNGSLKLHVSLAAQLRRSGLSNALGQ